MNIVKQKSTGYVMWIGDAPVFERDGVFTTEEFGLGLSVADHEVAQAPAPEPVFIAQCMTYNGEWAIGDQVWYDMCWQQYCASHNANQRALRAKAYAAETDSIFFQYQRGVASKPQWLSAVEAVKARYPYIGVPAEPLVPGDQPTVEGAQTL